MQYTRTCEMATSAYKTPGLAERNQPTVTEDEVLNWDYALEVVPPPIRSGTIEVTLTQVEIPPPGMPVSEAGPAPPTKID